MVSFSFPQWKSWFVFHIILCLVRHQEAISLTVTMQFAWIQPRRKIHEFLSLSYAQHKRLNILNNREQAKKSSNSVFSLEQTATESFHRTAKLNYSQRMPKTLFKSILFHPSPPMPNWVSQNAYLKKQQQVTEYISIPQENCFTSTDENRRYGNSIRIEHNFLTLLASLMNHSDKFHQMETNKWLYFYMIYSTGRPTEAYISGIILSIVTA